MDLFLVSSVALLPIHVIIRVNLSLFTDNKGKYSQDKFAKSDNLAIYIGLPAGREGLKLCGMLKCATVYKRDSFLIIWVALRRAVLRETTCALLPLIRL